MEHRSNTGTYSTLAESDRPESHRSRPIADQLCCHYMGGNLKTRYSPAMTTVSIMMGKPTLRKLMNVIS